MIGALTDDGEQAEPQVSDASNAVAEKTVADESKRATQEPTAVQNGPEHSEKGDGDPSVAFNKLDFDSVDYTSGPQGQPVVEERVSKGFLKITLKYKGNDGNWYQHGEQRTIRPGAVVDKIENYAFGTRHGMSFLNTSSSRSDETGNESWYYNGDLRKSVFWADKRAGRKMHEINRLKGKLHGWYSLWGEDGELLVHKRHEHGKVVEESLEPFGIQQ